MVFFQQIIKQVKPVIYFCECSRIRIMPGIKYTDVMGHILQIDIETFYIDLKDMSHDISVLNARHDPDPAALTKVNDRLNLLYNLLKKHHVSSVSELILLWDQLRKKIEEIDSLDFN